MVGKEFNDYAVDGLFAATPPLEALRLLLSWAATSDAGRSTSVGVKGSSKNMLIADVSRAFFEAPAKRDLCVELPEEALEGEETTTNTVGKLLASLYGTRDASANWQEEVIKCMREWGVRRESVQRLHVPAQLEADKVPGAWRRLCLCRGA